jgi:SAM-dependent methyltransferase
VGGRDHYAGGIGRFYAFYIERRWLAAVVGRLVWGFGTGALYASLRRLSALEPGSTVLDAPCGGGLALRYLEPGAGHRYIGVDSSPAMLERARRSARRRGFERAELHLADIERLPLADAAADVGLLYNGLHCFARPEVALREVVRCLRPGSPLLGSMLVRGAARRADAVMEREAANPDGMLGPGGTEADLRRWLAEAGLQGADVSTDGALAVFAARLPA